MIQTHLSRTWFLGHGCKQVPPDFIGGKVLWAHPEGYFLNACGQKLAHSFAPVQRTPGRLCHNGKRGVIHPNMRRYGAKACHILMAIAFYGERPTYISKKAGKPYVGIVHHLIEDPLNYRPENLLCFLTREQHTEADRRQRALRKIAPNGDLYQFLDYDTLRRLQDPRITSREQFETELSHLSSSYSEVCTLRRPVLGNGCPKTRRQGAGTPKSTIPRDLLIRNS